jgi:hypothetical protein
MSSLCTILGCGPKIGSAIARVVADAGSDLALLYGSLYATVEALPSMREAGRGALLYTGGGFGIMPATFTASHSIGKAALRNWVRNLHAELAPDGIHAATVTITRPVGDGGEYDRETIARHYLDLHRQPVGSWEGEIIHKEL